MSRILLLPHGTSGDVLPMIWIGRQLVARGHQVALVWLEAFRELVEKSGLEFIPFNEEGYQEMINDPGYWKPHQGIKLTYAYAGRCCRHCCDAVLEHARHHGAPDLMLAPMINFAARLLRETLGVPLISTHLSTLQLMSSHAVPRTIPAARLLRRLPVPLRKFFMHWVAPYDRHAAPQLRRCCGQHGVRLPRRLRDWWHSPDGSLALFPEWFAKPQPDWPVNTLQWDFPLEDLADIQRQQPELDAFLDAGDKPVVFTLGTAHLHSERFFAVAAIIIARLGRRAVFLARDASQVPAGLPASVFVTAYAPFSTLLPRAAAFVHHGGIGTLSQCLAAGLPQLIIPMAYDQPDNAKHVEALGAGLRLPIARLTVERALPLLRRCLEDEGIRRQAAEGARRVRNRPPVGELVEWLETQCARP